jgi:predicted RNA binding protein YcfA (HicA-like mRNA interferase family)
MKSSCHSSREIIAIIEADGWVLKNVEGSHYQFRHPTKKGKVTVKHPDKDVPPKTFNHIMQQAEL